MKRQPNFVRQVRKHKPMHLLRMAFAMVLLSLICPNPLHAQGVLANPLPNLAGGALATADFDGDGDMDVYLSGVDTSGMIEGGIYRRDPAGFSLNATGPAGFADGDCAWGDFDADGDPDLAVAGKVQNSTKPILQIWQNNGGGVFAQLSVNLPPLEGAELEWADLDNDGDLDLLAIGCTPGSYGNGFIFRNDGAGIFTSIIAPWKGYAKAMTTADFNGDNLPDVATITHDPRLAAGYNINLWQNQGSMIFAPKPLPQALTGQGNLSWADMDGGGTKDLWVSAWGKQERTALLMNNAGIFSEAPISLPESAFSAITTTDYDNDGKPDVAFAGADAAGNIYTRIYRNTGSGLSLNASTLIGVLHPKLQFADMDGNGQPDLIVSGFDGNTPSTVIYFNTAGTFQP